MADQGPRTALVRRALDHVLAGTTDLATEVVEHDPTTYVDPRRHEAELHRVFRSNPLVVAVSASLPEPGSVQAVEVAGLPLLVTRDLDGRAHVLLDACRHRGARLCPPAEGAAPRLVCPYHGWSYDLAGPLASITAGATVGAVDRSERGLVAFPAEERHGLVWATLDPGGSIDLDGWLGAYDDELASLDLASWHLHDQVQVEGPNWKLAFDGYLEAYHGEHVHAATLGPDSVPNTLVVDTFGPHQRLVFPLRSITELAAKREATWPAPGRHCVPTHTIFPNVSLAGTWQDIAVLCQVHPNTDVHRSTTVQSVFTRTPPSDRRELARARAFSGLMLRVHRDEDYVVAGSIRPAIGAVPLSSFLLGRNELALQHFHGWLDRLVHEGAHP